MKTKREIDADKLIARIMRLSAGDLQAQWTAAGIVKVIEEEIQNVSFVSLNFENHVI